jgi:hypothetical protein
MKVENEYKKLIPQKFIKPMVISDSSLSNIKFTPTFLGQRINTYEVPLDIFNA